MTNSVLGAWVCADTSALGRLMAQDIVFSGPVADYAGRGRASYVVGVLCRRLDRAGPARARWCGEGGTVSAFTATVNGDSLHGMLREEHDSSGLLVQVTLFLRPRGSLNAATKQMADLLSDDSSEKGI